jgi:hypothetical protein
LKYFFCWRRHMLCLYSSPYGTGCLFDYRHYGRFTYSHQEWKLSERNSCWKVPAIGTFTNKVNTIFTVFAEEVAKARWKGLRG